MSNDNLIPAYINLGQALERRGKTEAAQYWWQELKSFQQQETAPFPNIF